MRFDLQWHLHKNANIRMHINNGMLQLRWSVKKKTNQPTINQLQKQMIKSVDVILMSSSSSHSLFPLLTFSIFFFITFDRSFLFFFGFLLLLFLVRFYCFIGTMLACDFFSECLWIFSLFVNIVNTCFAGKMWTKTKKNIVLNYNVALWYFLM